jgi:hypothetical protein
MKELAYVFIGLSIGMLSPLEEASKLYALIPLFVGIFLYFFEVYDNYKGGER